MGKIAKECQGVFDAINDTLKTVATKKDLSQVASKKDMTTIKKDIKTIKEDLHLIAGAVQGIADKLLREDEHPPLPASGPKKYPSGPTRPRV